MAESRETGDSVERFYAAVVDLARLLHRNQVHLTVAARLKLPVERAGQELLRVLAGAEEPLRINDLAERLKVRSPHVTRQVKQLEDLELVVRARDSADQRAQRITITPAGREVVERLDKVMVGWLRESLGDVPVDDWEAAIRVIDRLVEATGKSFS